MKNISFIFSLVCIMGISSSIHSQNIGINPDGSAPDASAMLDIKSTNKGILIPRINITNLNDISPITGGSIESLLVYNTNTTTGKGYYYWSGSKWVNLSKDDKAWGITGNTGTTPSSSTIGSSVNNNFIGTTDNKDFVFATNNLERLRIKSNGSIGIGTNNPDRPLTIAYDTEWNIVSRSKNTTATNRNHLLFQRANGSSAVSAGFTLGGLSMGGYDGADYSYGWNGGAEITALASENWSATNKGTNLIFSVSKNGSASPTEIMRISANGNVGIGEANPSEKLQVNGKIKIVDGNQAQGKILTSDAAGVGTWQDAKYQAYTIPGNSGTSQWINLGTLTLSQNGKSALIKIITNNGYNANNTQNSEVYVRFKTSNASSVDANGFAGDASYWYSGSNTQFANQGNIKIKANAAGTSATKYDIYIYVGAYIGNGSFYTVETTEGTWQHVGATAQPDPGVSSSTVLVVPMDYHGPTNVNSEVYNVNTNSYNSVTGAFSTSSTTSVQITGSQITITQGTWLIQASAEYFNNTYYDGTILCLYNITDNQYYGASNSYGNAIFHPWNTIKTLTVNNNTEIQVRIYNVTSGTTAYARNVHLSAIKLK